MDLDAGAIIRTGLFECGSYFWNYSLGKIAFIIYSLWMTDLEV